VNGPAPVSQTFPDNEVVSYTFDAGGAQQSITATPSGGTAQPVVKRVLRNARGQTTEVDYGDGTSSAHQYNDTGDLRLHQLETFLTATPATILQMYTYSFDYVGNVTGVSDYCDEGSLAPCPNMSSANTTYTATYSYDSRNQLIGTTRKSAAYPYKYDALGNLTNKENVAQSYFPSGAGRPHPHAVSQVATTPNPTNYAYDANGNLTGTTGAPTNVSLTWNADDMPVRMTWGSTVTTKSFLGESLWKKVQGTTTTYYLPSMRVENGLYRKSYGVFAERDTDKSLKFYHGDHLGSSVLVTNASGTPVHRQAHKPYGEDIVSVGSFTPKYQFTFKEREGDNSGLYDYGARMYDPMIGRWLSSDSSDADGLNRYAYVRNNPLRYIDPTGHQSVPESYTVDANGKVIITVRVQAAAPTLKEAWTETKANARAALKWGGNSAIDLANLALWQAGGHVFKHIPTTDYERQVGRAYTIGSFFIPGGGWAKAATEVAEISAAERITADLIDLGVPAELSGVQKTALVNPELISDAQPWVKQSIVDAKAADIRTALGPSASPHILVADVNGQLVALDGTHTLAAARRLNLNSVPVRIVDLDGSPEVTNILSGWIGHRATTVAEFPH
jgi:RHS repeat-associated protein